MTALEKLTQAVRRQNSLLCIGLDPDTSANPLELCWSLVEQTASYAAAFKPNSAFFESRGPEGMAQLETLCHRIKQHWPEHFLVLDAKRGDIGNTNEHYARWAFEQCQADAITLHPYLGREALLPFLTNAKHLPVLLVRTSNPGSELYQNLELNAGGTLWQRVLSDIAQWPEQPMAVFGATWPQELELARQLAPKLWFLVPGVGAQGADAAETVRRGQNAQGEGLLISVSRSVMRAADPAAEALALKQAINHARHR